MPLMSKNPKLVEIIWLDTIDSGGDWMYADALPEPVTVRTVGYVIAEKQDHIVLMRDFYIPTTEGTSGNMAQGVAGGVITIPRGMIVAINPLSGAGLPKNTIVTKGRGKKA